MIKLGTEDNAPVLQNEDIITVEFLRNTELTFYLPDEDMCLNEQKIWFHEGETLQLQILEIIDDNTILGLARDYTTVMLNLRKVSINELYRDYPRPRITDMYNVKQ